MTGGGTLPGVEIPSWGVHVDGDHTASLRRGVPPVVATVREGVTRLDLRTVAPHEDEAVAAALAALAVP